MMRKKILITIVIILALSFTGTPAFAYNYTINGEGYDDLPVQFTQLISYRH